MTPACAPSAAAHDRDLGTVRRALEPAAERGAHRVEQHVASSMRPPETTMSAGSRMFAKPHEADGHVPGVLGDELDRRRIARLRGLAHVQPVTVGLVAAGQLEHGGRPPGGRPLPPHAHRAHSPTPGLPVTPLPARAERPVGIDLEVPDLGAEAVRAAQHLAPGDDAATETGAERDQQHLALHPRAAPCTSSATTAALASLSTIVGSPTAASRRRAPVPSRNAGTLGE